MNNLLIFFALPVATIILAIVLQKILKSPLLVSATFFAIYLVVTFAAFDESFLVFAILYTLIALITALITRFFCCLIRNSTNPCINPNAAQEDEEDDDEDEDNNNGNNCGCGCNQNRGYINPYYVRRNYIRR